MAEARIILVGDVAGGAIQNTRNLNGNFVGKAIAVEGDAVASHGTGAHANATMTATSDITINGYRICREGDVATCGHAAVPSITVKAT